MLDIHSHILPAVDDGAQNTEESLAILKAMYKQGIHNVVATPHFYPHRDSLEDFENRRSNAFTILKSIKETEIPNIYLGCEILYYSGISRVSALKNFTLNGSEYILLELNPYLLNKTLFGEILYIIYERNLIPIIAHIERYYKARGYKDLLRFVKENKILTQLNATSFLSKKYEKTLDTLFRNGIPTFIATDSHSMEMRPPLLKHAFKIIENEYGTEVKQKLLKNADNLLNEITQRDNDNEIF